MLRTIILTVFLLPMLWRPAALDRVGPQSYHEAVPEQEAVLSEHEVQLTASVRAAFEKAGRPSPLLDANIIAACRRLCGVLDCSQLKHGAGAQAQTIQQTLRLFGVTDSFFFPIVARPGKRATAQRLLVDLVGSDLAGMGLNRFGLAWEPGDDGLLVAVFTRRLAQLGPVPMEVEPGTSVLLWGALLDGASTPQVLFSTPDEALIQREPNLLGGVFWTQLYLPDEPGVYTVEVSVRSDGPQVASLFPLYAGVPVPSRPVLKLYPDVDESGGVRDLERQVLKLVNRERARRDVPELAWSPALARLARAHSRSMAEQAVLSHLAGAQDEASDLVYTENIALSTSITSAHAGLMGVPSHRRNILDREAGTCGVGIVAVEREEGVRLLYITERFGGTE
jgi:uncharacterized protein YkwD